MITCELLNLEFDIFALLQFNGIILKILDVTVLYFVMLIVCYFFGTGCKKLTIPMLSSCCVCKLRESIDSDFFCLLLISEELVT